MRRKLLMGNWKMNKLTSEAAQFAQAADELLALAKESDIDVGVAPTFISLRKVRKYAPATFIVAAQNCHYKTNGAYTGEVSIPMLLDIGINTVIIGHSERRAYDNETSEKCNLKILELLKANMMPIYCVGETLEQFENNLTTDIVKDQLIKGLKDVDVEDLADGHILALEYLFKGGVSTAINLGTNKGNSVKEVFEACEKITNQKISLKIYPRREGDPPILVADNNKARQILNWHPKRNLSHSIKNAFCWEQVNSKNNYLS